MGFSISPRPRNKWRKKRRRENAEGCASLLLLLLLPLLLPLLLLLLLLAMRRKRESPACRGFYRRRWSGCQDLLWVSCDRSQFPSVTCGGMGEQRKEEK